MTTTILPTRTADGSGVDFDKSRRFGAWYVAEHELRRVPTYKWSMLTTAIGSPLLYLLAFGVGLATLIKSGGSAGIDGVSYAQFVIPAFLCAGAVATATEEFTFGVLLGFKWNETYLGMNAGPITPRQIAGGHILFTILRMTATSGIFLVIAMAFGAIRFPEGLVVLPIAVLGGLAFGIPIAAYSTTIREDRGQFAVIGRTVVLPMTLFSGTVFPITQLPIWLQWIGWISPLWHSTQLARDAAYGHVEPGWLTLVHIVVLVALIAIGAAVQVRLTVKRLNR
jgi:lipooligosaccharide transport system permease protein